MLGEELAKRPYVKAHHRAVLMGQIGRSAASVEFKHRNISAVLQELGLPWIWGYKPALNFQDALFDGVDRYLSSHREVVEQPHTLVAHAVLGQKKSSQSCRPRHPVHAAQDSSGLFASLILLSAISGTDSLVGPANNSLAMSSAGAS